MQAKTIHLHIEAPPLPDILELVSAYNDTRCCVKESRELVTTLTKDLKDKIQSISKDRATHLDSSLKLSARVEQLIKQEGECIVTIQQLQADLAWVEDTAAVITCSVNDMLLHQSNLIVTKLQSGFLDKDWSFVSQIDAYQNLDDEEEVAAEAGILSEGVQDPAMVCALRL
ncbi:hypothetical protein JCGZ_18535 [Jatropha curcas]|uniref:Uncharacterized protein n=1 Tax=Jatropha curcas TaxID=180498 RepID=A0A067LCX4_JATCU|nr:hypothetical protein JCGZ_18535 [Jatropha curcas]